MFFVLASDISQPISQMFIVLESFLFSPSHLLLRISQQIALFFSSQKYTFHRCHMSIRVDIIALFFQINKSFDQVFWFYDISFMPAFKYPRLMPHGV